MVLDLAHFADLHHLAPHVHGAPIEQFACENDFEAIDLEFRCEIDWLVLMAVSGLDTPETAFDVDPNDRALTADKRHVVVIVMIAVGIARIPVRIDRIVDNDSVLATAAAAIARIAWIVRIENIAASRRKREHSESRYDAGHS
jgi:hypothetical protein